MDNAQEDPAQKRLSDDLRRCFEGDWLGTESQMYFTDASAFERLFKRKTAPYGSVLRNSSSSKRAGKGVSMRRETIVRELLIHGVTDPKAVWDQFVVQPEATPGPSPTSTPAPSSETLSDPAPPLSEPSPTTGGPTPTNRFPDPLASPKRRGVLVIASIVVLAALVLVVVLNPFSSAAGSGCSVSPAAGDPVEGHQTHVIVKVKPSYLVDSGRDLRLLVKPLNSDILYVQLPRITNSEDTCHVFLGTAEPTSTTFRVILASFNGGVLPSDTLQFRDGSLQYSTLAETQLTRSQ